MGTICASETTVTSASSAPIMGKDVEPGVSNLAGRVRQVNLDKEFKGRRQWKFDPKRLTDGEFRRWYSNAIARFVGTNKGVTSVVLDKYMRGLDHVNRCWKVFGSPQKAFAASGVRVSPQGEYYVLPRRTAGSGKRISVRAAAGYKGKNISSAPAVSEPSGWDTVDLSAYD